MAYRHSHTMLMLVVCFSVSVLNLFLIVNASNLPSLHQLKPLCHDHEKIALLLFKQSFRIDCSSSSNPEFAFPKVNSWDDSSHFTNATTSVKDCCLWDGVTCSEETGHVVRLNLHRSCLYGTFPSNSSLFGLDHLLELNLADNNFNYSEVPSAISRLHKLTHLNLSESGFSGQIPSHISNLSSLSHLDLSLNADLKLHGLSFEKLVYNLTHLTHLVLDQVDISSTIPNSLSNRTSIKVISLESCNLNGEVPANLLQIPKLEKVSFSINLKLGGYLPEFHSNSPLRVLSLSGTIFSGKLPNSLGNLGLLSSRFAWCLYGVSMSTTWYFGGLYMIHLRYGFFPTWVF